METSQRPLQILASLDCKARTLHPGLLSLVEERLHALAPASADPSSAAELLGLLAAVLHNACSGRVAEEYADGPEDAMQDCVRLAGTIVSWMTQGGGTAVASSSPDNCSSLKDFVAAALELASHAFFSQEWFQRLGPARYMQTGNAVRCYVRDLAPVAMDATEACWRAVEQQQSYGDACDEELLGACRALFGALFEGLRHLGTTSAERINDPSVPREMRSFAGLNILWTGLSRVLTALPPEAMRQLLNGCAVQSVLKALLGYLTLEVRTMAASTQGDYDVGLKVSRFWLQHAARVAQAHPAAAASCWDELLTATAEVYRHIAATAVAGSRHVTAVSTAAEPQVGQQQLLNLARDLESAIACKMTSLLAVILDAGLAEDMTGGGQHQPHSDVAQPASTQQLEARLAKLKTLAKAVGSADRSAVRPGMAAANIPWPAAGAVLLCLSLLQRAAHVSPAARAVMVTCLLPWAGLTTAVDLYSLALDEFGPAAALPSLDLPHQLAAAALALLAAAAEQQGGQDQEQGPGHDAATFTAGFVIVSNWGTCAHPLLSATASNVLSTLVQHCEPLMASRLLASVASLAAQAASAEAVAAIVTTVFICSASGGDASLAAQEPEVASVGFDSVSGRLERLLSSMLTAASPQTEVAWREVMRQLAPLPSQDLKPQGVTMYDCKTDSVHDGSAVSGVPSFQSGAVAETSLDVCGAASARVMWSAAAGAAAMHAAAAVARGDGPQPGSPVAGSVSEQELADRARHLLSAVRQAAAVVGSCSTGAMSASSTGTDARGVVTAAPGSASLALQLTRQWLAQLLGCLEATLVHVRLLGAAGLQVLISEIAELAAEMLQVLVQEYLHDGLPTNLSTRNDVNMAAVHAASRLVARTADCMPLTALAALTPALTWLAQHGPPTIAADVAVTAAYCNSPPPEALFHALLRSSHPAVMHVAFQSHVHVCRTVPQQYASSVRRLFPPEFGPSVAAGQEQPAGGPSALLAAMFKSYMSRRVSDEEAAATLAAMPQARQLEGERLAAAANETCVLEALKPGQSTDAVKLRRSVCRSAEAMQVCMGALAALRHTGADARTFGGVDEPTMRKDFCCSAVRKAGTEAPGLAGLALNTLGRVGDDGGCGGGPQSLPNQPFIDGQLQQRQQALAQLAVGHGSGLMTPLVADDNAAMDGLKAALSGLERAMGALHATVVAQRVNKGRPSDWDQLQAHTRALLGDLSSASSRIRNMNELLYALQGR